MAGGIGLSKALSLMSGVPLAKAGTVLAEKLSITKRLDGGAIGGLLKQVVQDGNLSSILQNPVAGLVGGLQTQIAGLTAQLSAVGGFPQLTAALGAGGGLAPALTTLASAGNNLAGLTTGAAGFFDLLGHNNIAEMFGADVPAGLSLATAAAPLTAQPLLQGLTATLPALVQSAISGQVTDASAAQTVLDHTATVQGVVTNSANAIASGQALLPMLSVASAVAGSIAVPSWATETPFQAMLGSLVQPAARTAMDAATALQVGPRAGMSHSELIAEVERMAGLLTKIRSGE